MFYKWLLKLGAFRNSKTILDVATGTGANVAFLAQKHPEIDFIGIDYNARLVEAGNNILHKLKINNAVLQKKDLYKINGRFYKNVDGIVSFQTLSWLPHYKTALQRQLKLRPKWIAATSLFYEGKIDVFIKLHTRYDAYENGRPKEYYFNVYSLDMLKRFLAENGYKKFRYTRYDIDLDLKRKGKDIGTYTERLKDGRRLQFSGPLFLPWYFIYAER